MDYNQTSVIIDSMTVGEVWPLYTWRKGGAHEDDNHLYLLIGSAHDEFDIKNVLIEIDPATKVVIFHNEARLLNGLSFDDNILNGSSLKDGTVTSNKLAPGIVIDGSVSKLTASKLIDGVGFDGSRDISHFYLCQTESGDQIKIISCPGFKKTTGSLIYVKFKFDNTHNEPLLNVNDTGPSPITYGESVIDPDRLYKDMVFCFVYDGQSYAMVGSLDNKVAQVNSSNEPGQYNILLTQNANETGYTEGFNRYVEGVTIEPETKTLSINRLVSPLYAAGWLEQNLDHSIINGPEDTASKGNYVSFLKYHSNEGIFTLGGFSDQFVLNYTDDLTVVTRQDKYTYQVKLLDKDGNATFPNKVKAVQFEGNATSATKAVNDGNDRNIVNTYATKVDVENNFINTSGDQMTGPLRLVAVQGESNTVASTVGYVDNKVRQEVNALKDSILNGVGNEYDSLKELLGEIQENESAITALQRVVQGFVKFEERQDLSAEHQLNARENINAFSADGGTLKNNGSITGNNATFNHYNVVTDDPTLQTSKSSIDFVDRQSDVIGSLAQQVNKDGSTSIKIEVDGKSIGLVKDATGKVSTYVDHPVQPLTGNEIATTQYISEQIDQAFYIENKEFSNIIATSTDESDNIFYFVKIKPVNDTTPWQAKIRVHTKLTSYAAYITEYESELIGISSSYSYKHLVHHKDDNYRSIEGLVYRGATNSAEPHLVGITLHQAKRSATSSDYSRYVKVEILDSHNCDVTFVDKVVSDASVNTTNYSINKHVVLTPYNGVYHINDGKLNDRLIQAGSFVRAGDETVHPHTLVMEDVSGYYHSIVTSANVGNAKLPTKIWLNKSKIYYYDGEKSIAINQYGTEKDVKYLTGPFDITYSFNINNAPNVGEKLYLKVKYDAAKDLIQLADNWLAYYMPGFDDGYSYILIGDAIGEKGGTQTTKCHLAYTNTMYMWSGLRYEPVGGGFGSGGVGGGGGLTHPFLQNVGVKRGDVTSGELHSIRLNVHDETSTSYDNKASVLAYIDHTVDTRSSSDVISTFSLNANDPSVSNLTNVSQIGVGFRVKSDGTRRPFTFASQPDLDDISTSIATTGWTEERLQLLAAAIADAFDQVTDTLVVSYASATDVSNLRIQYSELSVKYDQLVEKYNQLLTQHNQFLTTIAGTYMNRAEITNTFLTKTEASNLYLTKNDAVNTYLTLDQYQNDINNL